MSLTLSVGVANVMVGDVFVISVQASSGRWIVDAPLHLQYDPSRLEYIDAEEGDFLGSDGSSVVFLANGQSRPGDVSIGIGRLNRRVGVQGSGQLCRVRFRAVGAGDARVYIDRAFVWDKARTLIPVSTGSIDLRIR